MTTKYDAFDYSALLTAKKNAIITYPHGVGAFTSLKVAAEGLSMTVGEFRCTFLELMSIPEDVKQAALGKYDVLLLVDFDTTPNFLYGPLMNSIKLEMGTPFIIAGATSTKEIPAEQLAYFPEKVILTY